MDSTDVILIVLALALAVKQLSYALAQGSMFESLRRGINKGMHNDLWGFETLNELFSCKLCMTMQVSLWTVMLPGFLVGRHLNAAQIVLGQNTDQMAADAFLLFATFMIAACVSGIALALWIGLEYPAKRYENLAIRFEEAQQTIADLRAGGAGITTTTSSATLSKDDFREFMESINTSCRGIGCGYSRRDCRSRATKQWLQAWADDNPSRQQALPKLRAEFQRRLPDYFRDYSSRDETIEDERAFGRLYTSISRVLA